MNYLEIAFVARTNELLKGSAEVEWRLRDVQRLWYEHGRCDKSVLKAKAEELGARNGWEVVFDGLVKRALTFRWRDVRIAEISGAASGRVWRA